MSMEKTRNILLVPDSFKESLSSQEVAKAICSGLSRNPLFRNSTLVSMPFADGGEGSLEVLHGIKGLGLEKIHVSTVDSLMRPIRAPLCFSRDMRTVYMEMASICGLESLTPSERSPMRTTTFGIGLALKQALSLSKKRLRNAVLFLGGSSTCDAGIGMLQALGIRFRSKKKALDHPGLNGSDMSLVTEADKTGFDKLLGGIRFTLCCDVTNPLHGKRGASFVFAAQKGANRKEIAELDAGLRNMANVLGQKDLAKKEGMGAAGGIGFGIASFFRFRVVSGAEYLSGLYGLDRQVRRADLVITGEGKFDAQSLDGKLVSRISKLCAKEGKPVIVVAGKNGLEGKRISGNIIAVLAVMDVASGFEDAMRRPAFYIRKLMREYRF